MKFNCITYGSMETTVEADSPHDAAVKLLLGNQKIQLDEPQIVQVYFGDTCFHVKVTFSSKTETIGEELL